MDQPPVPLRPQLGEYLDKFKGADCWIIGRGTTLYDYAELGKLPAGIPVGFINDAVGMETHLAAHTPSFFFAIDSNMTVWLVPPDARSAEQKSHLAKLAPLFTRLRSMPIVNHGFPPFWPIVVRYNLAAIVTHQINGEMNRREFVAGQNFMYQNPSGGSISIGINFFSICGCSTIYLVGCDGQHKPYDQRLPNLSKSPFGGDLSRYTDFRIQQDQQMARLGMKAVYVGTPPK